MTRQENEMTSLLHIATEARNLAHAAYEIALQNRKTDGDTDAAYRTLLKTNQVRDLIHAATNTSTIF